MIFGPSPRLIASPACTRPAAPIMASLALCVRALLLDVKPFAAAADFGAVGNLSARPHVLIDLVLQQPLVHLDCRGQVRAAPADDHTFIGNYFT